MSAKLLVTTSLFAPLLLSLACSALSSTSPKTATPPLSEPAQIDIDREEQAVYSQLAGDNELTLFLETTSTNVVDESPQQTMDQIKAGFKGVSEETIESYLSRNKQPTKLSPNMDLGTKYQVISADDLSKITRQPNWGKILEEKYPGSQGYLVVSRVGFNRTLDQAVIYVGQVAGPMMGGGYYYLMEKQDGGWVVKEQIMVWIS